MSPHPLQRFLRDAPIKRKLTAITMFTSLIALLLACGAFTLYERATFRTDLLTGLISIAEMTGYHSAAAISFNDPVAAEQTLNALRRHPHLTLGAIYDARGQVLAKYQRPGLTGTLVPPPIRPAGHRFTPDHAELFHPIDLAGEKAGWIFLQSDFADLRTRFGRYLVIAVGVLIISSLLALLLTLRLQGVISHPIAHLVEVANAVATRQDYATRARKQGNDELGQLVDGFNEMLAHIQTRDRALREARATLEQRVAERTASLKIEIDGREKAQAALQKSLERHEYVARASHDVLWDWDLKTNLVHWGEGLQTQLGYAPAAIHPALAWWEERRHPDDRARVLAELHAVLEQRAPLWEGEYRFQRGDGSYATMLNRACVLYDAAGQPTRLVGAMADITDRKRAEAELAQAAQELLAISRQAGMAEVATSVLHNVGNVLNSVSVSAEVVAGKVRQPQSSGLQRVALLLREHAHDLPAFLTQDPRGRALPDYLLQLVAHLGEPQAGILQELDELRKNLEHIKEIVAMQQRYARGSTVWETIALPDLVEDALRINAAGFGRHDVLVLREFSPVSPVVTDRHMVLQILVNLVNNAKYALARVPGEKRMRVCVTAHGTAGVSIAVMDNGVGIAPENLRRIFQHGFTTKPDGHGFGLHSGALAAKELGGRLTASSDGVGQGATFTLELPLQNPHAGS